MTEDDGETFKLSLNNPVNATIADTTGICIISDNNCSIATVNGETGNVQIDLLLNNNDLSLTGGNTVTLPTGEAGALWNLTSTGSNIFANIPGNVGIGTGAFEPDEKLTVNGRVYAKEVVIDLAVPGPDYVFENNYKLRTVAELDRFLSNYKHLPEIPSAREMKDNGLNLSELNMQLLKKIEELTLYIIDQEKRINMLENNKSKK